MSGFTALEDGCESNKERDDYERDPTYDADEKREEPEQQKSDDKKRPCNYESAYTASGYSRITAFLYGGSLRELLQVRAFFIFHSR